MKVPGLDAPVGSVWCVGRNYAEHAREMRSPVPTAPLVFLKPASSVLPSGGVLRIPPDCRRVEHELELVVARDADGALKMAAGVDFTARDLQDEAKRQGLPWTSSKGRPGFAALGPFVPADLPAALELSVNGAVRQRGDTADMIFPVARLLEHLDAVYGVLSPGDLVFTGTPKGVAPVFPGDRLEASAGSSRLNLSVR